MVRDSTHVGADCTGHFKPPWPNCHKVRRIALCGPTSKVEVSVSHRSASRSCLPNILHRLGVLVHETFSNRINRLGVPVHE